MTLGAPWDRPLKGRLDRITIDSTVLRDNPLGDPHERPLYVYLPPGFKQPLPSIYVLQGFTGQLDMWLNRTAFEPTMIERVDALFSSGEVPPALVVFVDAWTSYGGSQFLNSSATGRYTDYICDEVVSFIDDRYPTLPHRDYRGVTGKSSGGYGAMVLPMLRPDTFAALASHAGDALFEVCYLPDIRKAVRSLRDHFDGSYDVFFDRLGAAEAFDFGRFGDALNIYAMAACYSPDDDNPPKVLLPFDVESGRLNDEVWQRWLQWDPVRVAPRHAEALESMKLIYVDAGRSDEYFLDLGAQAFAREAERLGANLTFELFDGTHGGLQHRYPKALAALAGVLAPVS